MSETDIQRTVCEYLERRGHFFSRINNVPIFDQKRKVMRKMPKYSLKGFPDILVLWNGFPIFLEIKTKIGRQSVEQKDFQKRCEAQGIEYYIIREILEVKKIGL